MCNRISPSLNGVNPGLTEASHTPSPISPSPISPKQYSPLHMSTTLSLHFKFNLRWERVYGCYRGREIFFCSLSHTREHSKENIPHCKHFYTNIWRVMITIVSILRKNMYGVFVLRHYLFLEAHSFPRASLSENCLYLRGDNVHKQISAHIFVPNRYYCTSMYVC